MASKAADDIIQRLSQLSTQRSVFETAWQQVVQVAAPDAQDFSLGLSGINMGSLPHEPTAARNSRKLFDSTAVWAVDRLASGIEALVMPQSDYWHNYQIEDLRDEVRSDEERLWLQQLRNHVFRERYDADSGFVNTIQTAIRRCIQFGNAFFFVEDGVAGKSRLLYRYMPLRECFVSENHQGMIDTFYRYYTLTARQAEQKWPGKLPPEIAKAATDPNDMDRPFTFIHCISPRGDHGYSEGIRGSSFRSCHIAVDAREIVHESGFYEFPIIDFRWMAEPGRVYGEGPIMRALADIQSVNAMARNELIASEQSIRPPLLVANAGVMNRPNTAPGAINYGGMTPNGQKLIEPMFSMTTRPDFAAKVLETKRTALKESLYINLFALLVQNPQMSATEAMIRANEKGELLGPAGARLQQSISHMVERELSILSRQGIFNEESPFRPPQSLGNRSVTVQHASPLDRARKGKEVEGTMQMLNILSPIMQIDESVAENFDGNNMARGLSERLGVPIEFIKPKQMVEAARQQRAAQMAQQQQAEIAAQMATAGKQGVEAMAAGQQAGIF